MIAFLTGTVAGRGADHCLLDVGGVGFRLAMSASSLSGLPAHGDPVTVLTYLHVREDELSLYGFETEAERQAFELLIGVSGVGPKLALTVLSVFSPEQLAAAVAVEDVTLLTSVPGIGKKTAQRVCLELRDKLGSAGLEGARSSARPVPAEEEAAAALLSMGFSGAEVSRALSGYEGDPADSAELLRHALRQLGGG